VTSEPIQQVTIVGGGTAGWLTAAILNAKLNTARTARRVEVVLIESPTVPIIGVGEGTVATLVEEFREIGIDENEFLRECNASFKFGVRFEGWNLNERGEPYSFIHPFGTLVAKIDDLPTICHFLSFGAHPGRDQHDASDNLTAATELIRLHRAPRKISDAGFSHIRPARYGYHVDAPKLAAFVRDFAVRRGVTHILDDVDDATVDQNGHISHLQLRRNGIRPVELVVDCTGFQSRLIGKLLGEPFVPYSDHLLCDRAMPIQIPHTEGHPLQVCTVATAMSAGWIWNVPLYNRIGTGYVYSSAFSSDEEALLEICGHLRLDPEKVDPRVIRMRVGRMRRAWVGNCVAIGLSGGFIEPLEATAILATTFAARQLVEHFPTKPIPKALVDSFNRRMEICYQGILDFIICHYYTANRTEPFWLAARSSSLLTDSLKQNLELWRHRIPEFNDVPIPALFPHISYAVCLASKNYFNNIDLRAQVVPPRERWTTLGQKLERERAEVRDMPLARQFLAHLRGEITAQKRGLGQQVVFDASPELAQVEFEIGAGANATAQKSTIR
jgi:tryptophan 6-halogenase